MGASEEAAAAAQNVCLSIVAVKQQLSCPGLAVQRRVVLRPGSASAQLSIVPAMAAEPARIGIVVVLPLPCSLSIPGGDAAVQLKSCFDRQCFHEKTETKGSDRGKVAVTVAFAFFLRLFIFPFFFPSPKYW